MKLRKSRSKQGGDLHFLSAQWEIVDIPGLQVQRCWNEQSYHPQAVWTVGVPSYQGFAGEISELARTISELLGGQKFATRSEALDAISAACSIATPS